ncbi:hypothetical protein D9757_005509 [Collybiopsis confluens]|uniref:Uncharacterized protein n=1 Tax=Collybiopsis confluens TaxID=2823264 RepID=A0A8H5HLJ6_9AGAR|nr:hypothetical protein D9757_005509 [Collybiopsis confluens]
MADSVIEFDDKFPNNFPEVDKEPIRAAIKSFKTCDIAATAEQSRNVFLILGDNQMEKPVDLARTVSDHWKSLIEVGAAKPKLIIRTRVARANSTGEGETAMSVEIPDPNIPNKTISINPWDVTQAEYLNAPGIVRSKLVFATAVTLEVPRAGKNWQEARWLEVLFHEFAIHVVHNIVEINRYLKGEPWAENGLRDTSDHMLFRFRGTPRYLFWLDNLPNQKKAEFKSYVMEWEDAEQREGRAARSGQTS